MNKQHNREWALIRSELHDLTIERDKLASKLLRIGEILRDNKDYDRGELIEELEGIVED